MVRRVRTNGDCRHCGKEMTPDGLTRHLRSGAVRRNVIEQTDQGGGAVAGG